MKDNQRTGNKRLTKKVQKLLVDDLTKKELAKIQEQLKPSVNDIKPVLLTCKLKIHPTPEQEEVLWKLAENCRLLYNFALKERIEWFNSNKELPQDKREKQIRFASQCKQLPLLKQKYPNYKQNYSKTLQQTLKCLDANFRSFYALRRNGYKDANPPRYKGKNYFTTLQYNQIGFKVVKNKITFVHFYPSKEETNIELSFQLNNKFDFSNRKIKHINLFQNHKTKEFFVSIVFELVTPKYYDNGIYQAIDQGVMNLVAGVNSHAGKTIVTKNYRTNKYWQPKIDELQSKRDHCKRYSNRWFWYNEKLVKMKRKEANQNKDFQHKVSKKIITNTKANTIIIGDLTSKEMSKKKIGDKKSDKSLHRSMHNSGSIARFARFLTYKAKIAGKKVIRISERNTTKRCSFCGQKKNRKLSERVIKCDCGLIIDRDINSAINILQRFLAVISLSQKRPVTGQRLLREFRQTFFAKNSCENGSPSHRTREDFELKVLV
ncbi:MAG: transposase [Candidatus Heimdallarchaeota archaeon]|nr:transposase [Candidatus Heimdallarchaeota archaeon]